ncbi:hypothetical protein QR680_000852 [Steinernema hermaphroditum]|uniref:Uncharacterized protein n=1 Tax=Steinernema hermaphroditum TaxID=289476 RepID=A0AA39LEX0_9BILA|nr:hypothetical protein QR680_000852 [Steinernema hermaphroditum]
MFLCAFFVILFIYSSLQLDDSRIDSNTVGIAIARENETLVARQHDDSVLNTQVERMFETIQKMHNLLTNMDIQFSSKMEALSRAASRCPGGESGLPAAIAHCGVDANKRSEVREADLGERELD